MEKLSVGTSRQLLTQVTKLPNDQVFDAAMDTLHNGSCAMLISSILHGDQLS